jgi:GT2 family glycosyltransferase
MKICQIIVTLNRVDTLMTTLKCVNEQSVNADYVVVVNNGSTDETEDQLSNFDLFKIYSLHLEENLGYGYGLSQGMKYALENFNDIDYFILMDDDSHPNKDLIKQLLEARKVVAKPGILCTLGSIDEIWNGPISIYKYPNKDKKLISNDPKIYSVDHVLVDGALIDRFIVDQIGTPREDVFMMCEDKEYSERIKKAGYSISVMADEHLMNRLHMGGGDRFSFRTRWRGYYHARNHMMILKEYFSIKSLVMYVIRQSKYLIAALRAEDRWDRIRLRLLGIYHGIRGNMGKTIDPENYPNK